MRCVSGDLFGRQCMKNIKCEKFSLYSESDGILPKDFQQD